MMTSNGDIRRLCPVERLILAEGDRINTQVGAPFSYKDFEKEYKHGTLRNAFSRLRELGLIYLLYRSILSFYAVGVPGLTPDSCSKMTPYPMRITLLIESLPIGDDKLHDIRLTFISAGLYAALLQAGWKSDQVSVHTAVVGPRKAM